MSKSRSSAQPSLPKKARAVVAALGEVMPMIGNDGGRLYDSDRSQIIWTAEDIKQFCAVASVELQAALLLARGQDSARGPVATDLERLRGSYIRMRQTKGRGRKGRRRVTIPVGPPLKVALSVSSHSGKPGCT
jgi:hypothetical protein